VPPAREGFPQGTQGATVVGIEKADKGQFTDCSKTGVPCYGRTGICLSDHPPFNRCVAREPAFRKFTGAVARPVVDDDKQRWLLALVDDGRQGVDES
jgi:hypothetical protein